MRVTNLSLELAGSNPRLAKPLHSLFTTIDNANNLPLLTLQTGADGIPFTTVFKGNAGFDNTVRIAATTDSSLSNYLELGYHASNSSYFLKPSSTAANASIPNLSLSAGGDHAGSLLLETNGQATLTSALNAALILTGGSSGIQLQGTGPLLSNLAATWTNTQTFTGAQMTITNNTMNSGLLVQAATTISKPLSVTALTTISSGLNLTGNTPFIVGSNVATSLGNTLNVVGNVTCQNGFTLLGPATLGSQVNITNDLTVGGKVSIQGINGLTLTQGSIVVAGGGATFNDKVVVNQGGFASTGDTLLTGNATITGTALIKSSLTIQGSNGLTVTQGSLNVPIGNIAAGGTLTSNGLTVVANGITTTGPFRQSGGNVAIQDGNVTLGAGNLTLSTGSLLLSNTGHITIANGYLTVGTYATIGGLLTGQSGLSITSGDTSLAGRLTVQGSQAHFLGTLLVDNNTTLSGTLDVTNATNLRSGLTVGNNLVVTGADGIASSISTALNVMGAVVVGSVANKVYLYADGTPSRFDTGIQVNNFPINATAGLNLTGATSTFNVASSVASTFNGSVQFGPSALVTMAGGLAVTSGNVAFTSPAGVSIGGTGNFSVASTSTSTFNGPLVTTNTASLTQGVTVTGTATSDIFTAKTKFQNLSGTFLVDNTGAVTSFNVTTGALTATNVTASASVVAPTLKNSNNSFVVTQAGYLNATGISSPTFTNPAGSFSVDASGNITASSISVPAISTTSGIYSDYLQANRFLNTNSTFTVSASGALVAASIVTPTIQNAATSPTYSQDVNGNVTLHNLSATGSISGLSATLSGLLTFANLQNAANTASITSNGTVIGKIFQNAASAPTLYTDTSGNLTVQSLTSSTSVNGATSNWTSSVTSASYSSISGLTTIDNSGVLTTSVRVITPNLQQALSTPTWSIVSSGAASFVSVIATGLVKGATFQNTSNTWSVSSSGAVNGTSLSLTGNVSTGTAGITLGNVSLVPASTSTSYSLTLPSALPNTASNLQVSAAGVVSYGSVSTTPPTSTYTTPTLPVVAATNVTGLVVSTMYTKATILVTTSGGQVSRYMLDTYTDGTNWYLSAFSQGTNLGINFLIVSASGQIQYTMSAAFGTTATFNIIQMS